MYTLDLKHGVFRKRENLQSNGNRCTKPIRQHNEWSLRRLVNLNCQLRRSNRCHQHYHATIKLLLLHLRRCIHSWQNCIQLHRSIPAKRFRKCHLHSHLHSSNGYPWERCHPNHIPLHQLQGTNKERNIGVYLLIYFSTNFLCFGSLKFSLVTAFTAELQFKWIDFNIQQLLIEWIDILASNRRQVQRRERNNRAFNHEHQQPRSRHNGRIHHPNIVRQSHTRHHRRNLFNRQNDHHDINRAWNHSQFD